ncbi:MAG: glutaredoxin family protein [Opitutaceae bacterium]|nr:glutaredoxin family protein [Opitutaceae bacterium]
MKGDPILYVRRGCNWCREARNFFATHGISMDIRDVDEDYVHLKRLTEVSGQANTPTFELDDFIISDFNVAELIEELDEFPYIKSKLGIQDDEPLG